MTQERYSKVSRRMWGDQKFRGLTPLPPCGQGLWFRLLTGPEQTIIPGVFQAWEAGLAQSLGWTLEEFRTAFQELAQSGLVKADWRAGLVWIPNAVHHNPPANPNIVQAWAKQFRQVPECELKAEIFQAFKLFAEGLPEGFRERFAKWFTEPFRKGLPNRLANQDQEQEPEQKISGNRISRPDRLERAGVCGRDVPVPSLPNSNPETEPKREESCPAGSQKQDQIPPEPAAPPEPPNRLLERSEVRNHVPPPEATPERQFAALATPLEDRETPCPLDLVERFDSYEELSKSLHCHPEQLRACASEFLSYWTIGGGAGKRRRNWPAKLREELRQKAQRGLLPPPPKPRISEADRLKSKEAEDRHRLIMIRRAEAELDKAILRHGPPPPPPGCGFTEPPKSPLRRRESQPVSAGDVAHSLLARVAGGVP